MKTRTQLHAAPVVIVGSIAYDNIETPFASGTRLLGGATSYAAIAAGYFTEARAVGIVGKDFDPVDLARLEENNVNTAGIVRDDSGDTFSWSGRYHDNFNKRDTLETRLNVFEKFRPDIPADWRNSKFLLLANIHPALQTSVLEQMSGAPFVVLDTMNLWLDIAREELERLVPRVNLFIINDDEAAQMTGERNAIRAGRALQKKFPSLPYLIVKKGEHGAVLFAREELFVFPAFPTTDVQDPTGAGDTFAGALTGFLAAQTGKISSAEIRRGIVYATVFASFAIEAFSTTRIEKLSREKILARCSMLAEITRV